MSDDTPPALRVTKGHPSDAEVAAVVVVLTSLLVDTQSVPAVGSPETDGWKSYRRLLRSTVEVSRDGWRHSLR